MESRSQPEQNDGWVARFRRTVIAPLVLLTGATAFEAQKIEADAPPPAAPVAAGKKDKPLTQGAILFEKIKACLDGMDEAEKLAKAKKPDLSPLPKLIEDLGSDEFKIRDKAHKGLWKLRDAALPMLSQALNKEIKKAPPNYERKRRLEDIIDKPIAPLRKLLAEFCEIETKKDAKEAALAFSPVLYKTSKWLKDLPDQGSAIRMKIAGAMLDGEAKEELVSALIRALQSKDPDLIWDAARVLRDMAKVEEAKAAVPALCEALKVPHNKIVDDVSYDVRREVAYALGAMGKGAEKAVPGLIAVLKKNDTPSELTWAARSALGDIDPEALKSPENKVVDRKEKGRSR